MIATDRSVHIDSGNVSTGCPFLVAVDGDLEHTYPHGFTCRLRMGPLCVPSADEFAWFCTTGCHHGCLTYRHWLQTGGAS